MLNQNKLTGADVALFYNSSFVDTTANGVDGEAYNVRQSLNFLGHNANTFTGTSASSLNFMAKNNDVIAIPELEVSALSLDLGAIIILKQFVMNGGTLVVFGSDGSSRNTDLINDIFGTNLTRTDANGSSNRQGEAAGTTFSGGPANIPDNNGTDAIGSGSPPLSESYYEDGSGNSTVMSFQVGKGQVTYLGWDWFNSFPANFFTGQDGGWNSVLDRAISETDGKVNGNTIKGTKSDDKVTLTKALKGKKTTNDDDYIKLKKGDDKAKAGDGADMIFGAKGKDKLIGQDGNDYLNGQHDNDILKGGAGADCFVFDTKLSKAGVDFIKDFKFFEGDVILLSQKVFTDLSTIGQLSVTDFNDHINVKANGYVEYNGDEFCRVKPGVVASGGLIASDFIVIA